MKCGQKNCRCKSY